MELQGLVEVAVQPKEDVPQVELVSYVRLLDNGGAKRICWPGSRISGGLESGDEEGVIYGEHHR